MFKAMQFAAIVVCAVLVPFLFAAAQDGPSRSPGAAPPPASPAPAPSGDRQNQSSPPAAKPAPAPVPAPPPRGDVTPLPRGESGGGIVNRPGTPPPRAANPRPQPPPNVRDSNRNNRGDEWRRDSRRYYYDSPPVFRFGFGVPGPGFRYYDYDDEPQQCGWIRERLWRGDRWVVRRAWRCWDD